MTPYRCVPLSLAAACCLLAAAPGDEVIRWTGANHWPDKVERAAVTVYPVRLPGAASRPQAIRLAALLEAENLAHTSVAAVQPCFVVKPSVNEQRKRLANATLTGANGNCYRPRAAQAAGVSSGSFWMLTLARPGRTSPKYARTGMPSRRQDSTTERIAATFGPA